MLAGMMTTTLLNTLNTFKAETKILQGCRNELGVRGIIWLLGVVLPKFSSWLA